MIKQIPNYILVYDNGTVVQSTTVTDQDKLHSDMGETKIINTIDFTLYDHGEWVRIRSVDW